MSKISSDDPNYFICNKCGRKIPIQNKGLHDIHCVKLEEDLSIPLPLPPSNTCKKCTFINPPETLICLACCSNLSNNNDVVNCKACSFFNSSKNDLCENCGSRLLSDEIESKDYFESRADLYVKCPTVNCLQYIELSNPGQIEKVTCPQCQYCFCSQCKELFHGKPNSRYDGLSYTFQERLACAGAKKIVERWRDYQINGRIFSYDETIQKHHVDLDEIIDSLNYEGRELAEELRRMTSEAYRLQCFICKEHIIGPRFSCINCVNDLEICINCSNDAEIQSTYHSLDHSFQILLEDEFPTKKQTEPSSKAKCCIWLYYHYHYYYYYLSLL